MNDFLLFLTILVLAGAVLAAGLLLLRLWSDRQREEDLVFLRVLVSKKESREEKEEASDQFGKDFREVIGVMDHLLQSMHSIADGSLQRLWRGQPFFSLEYAALRGEILFFIVCPRSSANVLEKQITSFYPDCLVDEVEEYNIFTPESVAAAATLVPSQSFSSTFRTYQHLKSDPLNAITNAFSKIRNDEGAALQIALRPVVWNWQRRVQTAAGALLNPSKSGGGSFFNPLTWIRGFFDLLTAGDVADLKEEERSGERVSQMVEEYSKSLDEKASTPGFEGVIRIVSSAQSTARAGQILDGITASFSQFSDVRGNSFRRVGLANRSSILRRFLRRNPRRPLRQALQFPRMLLGTSELAGFYHFPHIKYNRSDAIKWQNFKIAAAPHTIPEGGGDDLFIGYNTFRGEKSKIFMKNEDRFRHFYIIGQTGTGKSSAIVNMARQDFHRGKGVCIVDPHGSLIEDLLPYVPRSRADDVIYFNPADMERPMGLNLLEGNTPEERDLIALDAMNMMVKMFGEEIFGPRIQDYFRNGCLTLMEDEEEGGAITDLVRLFTDDDWQKYKVAKVKNPIVRSFWTNQMAKTGQREKQEMIPYFAAKFGQFYTNTLIRNIVGQTRSSFDIAQCMNEGKIILMNLSKGLIGDINSQLLGMIVVNKIQVAAMRRQQMEKDERTDFFLYIDEFQNFVTPSIESILSEARKYRLGLILAHQYIDQLEKESKLAGAVSLKGAVFGNVGTMLFYKIGPQDAEVGAKEMAPVFSEQDLVNLEAFRGCMKLCINGQPSRPFSVEVPRFWQDTTYPKDVQAAEAYKQLSRLKYGRQKDFVTREILRRIGA